MSSTGIGGLVIFRDSSNTAARFSAFLNLTNSRFVPEGEKPDRAGKNVVLFCAIDQQCVMCGGAAESVSCCYVARVAARAGVTDDFLATQSQNEAELVIVGVAALAKNSIWNGEKQQFSRAVLQDTNPGLRQNSDRVG